jgi:FixJ family two-component response regulator
MLAVVDDDPRLLESLENLFESAGYAVRSFLSGSDLLADGLDWLDCVVTDIGMPQMNGFDLREAIKVERPDVPVFLVTGRHEIGDQQRASRDDIAGFFRKPFDGQALLAAVAAALSRPSEETQE